MNSAFCGDFIVYRRADNWHKGRSKWHFDCYKNGYEEMSEDIERNAKRMLGAVDERETESEDTLKKCPRLFLVLERFLPYFTCFPVSHLLPFLAGCSGCHWGGGYRVDRQLAPCEERKDQWTTGYLLCRSNHPW